MCFSTVFARQVWAYIFRESNVTWVSPGLVIDIFFTGILFYFNLEAGKCGGWCPMHLLGFVTSTTAILLRRGDGSFIRFTYLLKASYTSGGGPLKFEDHRGIHLITLL